MDVDSPSISGVYDSLNGGGADTLGTIDRHKPSHTAVLTVSDANIPVEGDLDRRVAGGLVEETRCVFQHPLVPTSPFNGWYGTVRPLRMVDCGVDQRVTSCGNKGM